LRSSALGSQRLTSGLPATLASLSLLGIAIYVALDIILGFLPPHYSVIHQPESDYGVGPYGYLMGINFIVRGLFTLACVAALWGRRTLKSRGEWVGAGLLVLWAICSMLLAAFPTDIEGAVATTHGKLHGLLALIAFPAALIGELILSSRLRNDAGWQRFMRLPWIVAWLALPAFLWTGATVARVSAHRGTAGLAERVFLALVIAWIGIIAFRLREEHASSAST